MANQKKLRARANEAYLIEVGTGKYLARGGGRLLDEIDLWRGTFKDFDSAKSLLDFYDAGGGHYCTDDGARGPKMRIIKVVATFREV